VRARALWFVEPRHVEIRPVDVEREGDAMLVRTLVSGISVGTELLAYRGAIDPSTPLDEALGAFAGTFAFPFRYGYAAVGTVDSGGPLEPGSRVFAFHPHQDVFAVRPEDAISVEGVEPRTATLLPLVETALQVCLDAEARPGDVAAVTGLGVVGTLTALLMQRSAVAVIGVEPREDRRKLAAGLGLAVVRPDEMQETILERTEGAGADLVVEASGAGEALAAGLGALRREGTAVVASWYGSRDVALPLGAAFHRRRLTIRSSQVSTIPARLSASWDRRRRLRAARDLLSDLPLEALVTRTFAFEAADDAFAALDRGEPGLLHAALAYR
jgi:2-desacetyl-2-hydroxyethyl bacteriochlorophyllide A dehydrogenase